MAFQLSAPYTPTGDQPNAIEALVAGIQHQRQHQTLLGVTGSGKSVGYDDPVFIVEEKNGQKTSRCTSIGPFIDDLIEHQTSQKIIYYTQAFNPNNGEVQLFRISDLTRHSAPKKMYQLFTECGRSVTLTGDHNLWVLRNGALMLIKTTEVEKFDAVPVPVFLEEASENKRRYVVNILHELRDHTFFIHAEKIIQEYILKKGIKKIVEVFSQFSTHNPYPKLLAIRNEIRGSGIRIDIFLHLLKETENFNGNWDPQNATIGSASKELQFPVEFGLTEDWLKFIGYYLAEGCSGRSIVIASDSQVVRDSIEKFLKRMEIPFLVRPSSDYQISLKVLTTLMQVFCGKVARDKHLPSFWTELNKKDLKILLSAYFDGDGTVSKNGEIIAVTASQKLASDLVYALLRAGIWARMRKTWKRAKNSTHQGDWYYHIVISGQDNLRKFSSEIGFSITYKTERLLQFLTKQENTNKDLVFGVGEKLLQLRTELKCSQSALSKKSFLTRSMISLIEHNLRSPSRKNVKNILNALEKKANDEKYENISWWEIFSSLKKLLAVHWTPILSVEKTNYLHPYVYDFSVPIAETFLAGSGGIFVHNTFTMANVIQNTGLPTLVIVHNKTLAGQLYQEFRDFFPNNAVSYFVSYYDYYQPEAYIPSSDTYIEKEATINDEIDKLRLATTTNLLTRRDCIVVASVSCIYNLGSPVEFGRYILELIEGELIEGELIARETLLLQLDNLQYQRTETELVRGGYRLRGDVIQLWPANEDTALRIETLENKIVSIRRIDPVTGTPVVVAVEPGYKPKRFVIYPAKHYVMNRDTQADGLRQIEADLTIRLKELRDAGKIVEAYRLEQKVHYDVDMIRELGFVNGIENYSRYFDGRKPGDPPYSLIDYFHENARLFHQGQFLTIIDESHMTIPQIRAMHNGDRARKQTLIDYGFRLPSATDNRPLTFPEFMTKMKSMLFVSATPNPWEVSLSGNEVVEQLIRPTGLLDPKISLRPTSGQIEDLIIEIITRKQKGQRTLVTTLTKKMAEKLTEYLNDPEKIRKLIVQHKQHQQERSDREDAEHTLYRGDELPVDTMEIGPIERKFFTQSQIAPDTVLTEEHYPKVAYLHSDVQTLDRADILDDLRRGEYDVVVGINLLREGLDLPEVTLVAILDADKEGFLRSQTSLIQTIGRAARHESGEVIMYADRLTQSMRAAIGETQRRRQKQWQHNQTHDITATTIYKPIRDRMIAKVEEHADQQGRYRTDSPDFANKPKSKRILQLNKRESIDLSKIDPEAMTPDDRKKLATLLRRQMKIAANDMDFELAAELRDLVKTL